MRWALLPFLAACSTPPAAVVAPESIATPTAAPTAHRADVLEVTKVPPDPKGRAGAHGMIVFGSGDELYISHVPMTHAPHDVQLVARVQMSTIDGAPPDRLDTLHTLAPEPFRLDDLLAGTRRSFRAALHRGNFEAGGARIANVEVEIDKILVAHAVGAGDDASYYVFGGDAGWWAVHRLGAQSAYDAIAAVTFDRAPAAGVYRAAHRLVRGDALTLGATRLSATDVREVSCLVGPMFTAACSPP